MKTDRIEAIDVLRALTMLLMIFVNDLPWVKDVPHRLEHALPGEDMLGLADLVFPAFLFTVGLSVPFALGGRLKKGQPPLGVFGHVLVRSFALVVIGVLIANRRTLDPLAAGYGMDVYTLLIVGAFFLLWNAYPRTGGRRKWLYRGLRAAGIAVLAGVALTFQSVNPAGGAPLWLRPHWGILGTIGWTYLVCSLLYLTGRGRLAWGVGWFLGFVLLALLRSAGVFRPQGLWAGLLAGNAVSYAFGMAGSVTSLLVARYFVRDRFPRLALVLGLSGAALLTAAVFTHRYWIFSKLQATPPWMFACTGIAVLAVLGLHRLVDLGGKGHWFRLVRPAGVAALTCYMIPYVYYSVRHLTDIWLPEALTAGGIGLLKSALFAFFVVGITALLGKAGIRLRL